MKTKAYLTATAVTLAISCSKSKSTQQVERIEIGNSASTLGIVGGQPAEKQYFTSTGRFFFFASDNGGHTSSCTITKVGPRHFLTSGHCAHSNDDEVVIQSHKSLTKQTFQVASPNFRVADEPAIESGVLKADGGADWQLLILSSPKTFPEAIKGQHFLKNEFDTRAIGKTENIAPGHTVLAAGWGLSETENGNEIFTCRKNESRCNRQFEPIQYDFEKEELRIAYFNITHVAKSNTAFYVGAEIPLKSREVAETSPGAGDTYTSYFFEVDAEYKTGLIAEGDSGGPILNGNNEIVGLNYGRWLENTNPPVLYNLFSTFDSKKINELLEFPVIDYVARAVEPGKSFLVSGYKTGLIEAIGLDSRTTFQRDFGCEKIRGRDQYRLLGANLIEGEDYSCWTVPEGAKLERIGLYFKGEYSSRSVDMAPPGECSETLKNQTAQTLQVDGYPLFWGPLSNDSNDAPPPHMEEILKVRTNLVGISPEEIADVTLYLTSSSTTSWRFEASTGTKVFTFDSGGTLENPLMFDISEDYKQWAIDHWDSISDSIPMPMTIKALDNNVVEQLNFSIGVRSCRVGGEDGVE